MKLIDSVPPTVRELIRKYGEVAGALAALAILPMFVVEAGMTYQVRLLVLFLIFATLAVALNIAFGHTDQLFLFVGALAGIGAYTTALLAEHLGISAWVTFPVGGLAAGIFALLVSFVAARRGMTIIVIAILTLSLQLAIIEVFIGARNITGGSTGFPFDGLDPTVFTNLLGVSQQLALYYMLLIFLGLVLLFYQWLMQSKYGLAFRAIRQDAVAAESVGIDVVKFKTFAGFTAGLIIGLVGALYAQSEAYILPSMFSFQQVDVLVLIMLVLGGMRTTLGPIVGAGVIIYVNELLQGAGQWRMAILGAFLIVVFLYFREGIVPKGQEIWNGETRIPSPSAIIERIQ